jgi:hypothetical protein
MVGVPVPSTPEADADVGHTFASRSTSTLNSALKSTTSPLGDTTVKQRAIRHARRRRPCRRAGSATGNVRDDSPVLGTANDEIQSGT